MEWAILGTLVCFLGGLVWLGYKAYGAGKSVTETKHLKEGAEARERQDEEFEKCRGRLSDRISGRLRDDNRGET
jgi:hypothetical protein